MFIDVYNDVLNETHFQEVKHVVESAEFPWYIRYNRLVTNSTYYKDEDMYQNNPLFSFTHLCSGWDNIKTDYYDMTYELAEKCKIKANLDDYVTKRLRWRMHIRSKENVRSKPHLDMKDFEHKDGLKVGIFYLHDSDSPTYNNLKLTLEKMRDHALEHNVKAINMPKIGCGLDKLNWDAVRTMIKNVFLETDIKISVYYLNLLKFQ